MRNICRNSVVLLIFVTNSRSRWNISENFVLRGKLVPDILICPGLMSRSPISTETSISTPAWFHTAFLGEVPRRECTSKRNSVDARGDLHQSWTLHRCSIRIEKLAQLVTQPVVLELRTSKGYTTFYGESACDSEECQKTCFEKKIGDQGPAWRSNFLTWTWKSMFFIIASSCDPVVIPIVERVWLRAGYVKFHVISSGRSREQICWSFDVIHCFMVYSWLHTICVVHKLCACDVNCRLRMCNLQFRYLCHPFAICSWHIIHSGSSYSLTC